MLAQVAEGLWYDHVIIFSVRDCFHCVQATM